MRRRKNALILNSFLHEVLPFIPVIKSLETSLELVLRNEKTWRWVIGGRCRAVHWKDFEVSRSRDDFSVRGFL